MPLAQTAMGDVIEPRERGKYQGLFTGVFALCSVAGPLLGGVITVALSWRWIFFVNIPVGILAMVLIERGLRRPHKATSHRIDYAGAGLLTIGTTALLLTLSWGGAVYAWDSVVILAMAAVAIIWESASSPVSRWRRNRSCRCACSATASFPSAA